MSEQAADEWTTCEWPIQDYYGQRSQTCSRDAFKNRYGMSLCWQHEEEPTRHVEYQIRQGILRGKALEAITDAFVSAVANDDDLPHRVSEQIDRIVSKRLAQRVAEQWGVPA